MRTAETAAPRINGRHVDSQFMGRLVESPLHSSDNDLRRMLGERGYLFLRSAIPRHLIDAARAEVLTALSQVGEVRNPHTLGVASGMSRRELVADLGSFWKSLTESSSVRAVSHGWHSRRFVQAVLARPSIAHDYIYLRARPNGSGTRLHCDAPFFARQTEVLTAWIPLGEIGPENGALYVLKNSQRYANVDRSGDVNHGGEIASDPIRFAAIKNSRLLTAQFRRGDLVIFRMDLLHGSFDNISTTRRIRMSLDVRHQRRSASRDRRFFGSDPRGINGGGYGEMLCALPMDRQ